VFTNCFLSVASLKTQTGKSQQKKFQPQKKHFTRPIWFELPEHTAQPHASKLKQGISRIGNWQPMGWKHTKANTKYIGTGTTFIIQAMQPAIDCVDACRR
jgi:hypothetical protein